MRFKRQFPLIILYFVTTSALVSCGDGPFGSEETWDGPGGRVFSLAAMPDDGRIELRWSIGYLNLESSDNDWPQARYFEILFSDQSPNELETLEIISAGSPSPRTYVSSELDNGRPYYFAVRVWDDNGRTSLADTVMAIPGMKRSSEPVFPDHTGWRLGGAWSPDGRYIAYTSQVDSALLETGMAYGVKAIFTYEIRTGAIRRVFDNGELPAWSPDSERLVINSEQGRDANLVIVDVITGEATVLATGESWEYDASWTPSIDWITYLSDSGGQGSQIWRINIRSGDTKRLTSGLAPWASPDDLYTDPTWMSDEGRIVFARRRIEHDDADRDIYTMLFSGDDASPLIVSQWDDHTPVLSPDGSKVAFLSNRSGPNAVWLMDLSTRRLDQLTNSAGGRDGISWSPQGDKILYASHANGYTTLFTVRVAN